MITLFYLSLFAILYFIISLETIKARRSHQISLGVGDLNQIANFVSAHNNSASYAPILLFLLYLIEESQEIHSFLIHLLGFSIFLGRVFHYWAFRHKMKFKLRKLGMYLTLWPLLIMAALGLYAYINYRLDYLENVVV